MMNLVYVIAIAICIGLLFFLFQALRRLPGTEETSRHQLWRRRLRVAVALFLLAGLMCGIWGFLIEPNRLVVNQQAIQINNWPNDLKGLRIAVIGDIHAGAPFIDDRKLRLLVECTNQLQPDLVVLLGDFMSQDTWHGHRVAPEIIGLTGPAGPIGPVGPEGPEGPEGPPGPSSGGAPYVWICMAPHRPSTAGNQRLDVYVFNGSSSSADVSVNILNSIGGNLLGTWIPGTASETYPGNADGATVPLAAGHTRDVFWTMPTSGSSPVTEANVSFAVRVTSNQPIVVGANFMVGGFL